MFNSFHLQVYVTYLSYFWANNNITRETLGIKKVVVYFLQQKQSSLTNYRQSKIAKIYVYTPVT
jgi:hypothetical protein